MSLNLVSCLAGSTKRDVNMILVVGSIIRRRQLVSIRRGMAWSWELDLAAHWCPRWMTLAMHQLRISLCTWAHRTSNECPKTGPLPLLPQPPAILPSLPLLAPLGWMICAWLIVWSWYGGWWVLSLLSVRATEVHHRWYPARCCWSTSSPTCSRSQAGPQQPRLPSRAVPPSLIMPFIATWN